MYPSYWQYDGNCQIIHMFPNHKCCNISKKYWLHNTFSGHSDVRYICDVNYFLPDVFIVLIMLTIQHIQLCTLQYTSLSKQLDTRCSILCFLKCKMATSISHPIQTSHTDETFLQYFLKIIINSKTIKNMFIAYWQQISIHNTYQYVNCQNNCFLIERIDVTSFISFICSDEDAFFALTNKYASLDIEHIVFSHDAVRTYSTCQYVIYFPADNLIQCIRRFIPARPDDTASSQINLTSYS